MVVWPLYYQFHGPYEVMYWHRLFHTLFQLQTLSSQTLFRIVSIRTNLDWEGERERERCLTDKKPVEGPDSDLADEPELARFMDYITVDDYVITSKSPTLEELIEHRITGTRRMTMVMVKMNNLLLQWLQLLTPSTLSEISSQLGSTKELV